MLTIRRYSELIEIDDYYERFDYLNLDGILGQATFGFDRWLNQTFYHSTAWRRARDITIARDLGNDMAHPEYPIGGNILVHHMNPIDEQDLIHSNPDILDPEYLVCVSLNTHNAIHFGDRSLLPQPFIERVPNDTVPWRRL